jgi:hypothetical protein
MDVVGALWGTVEVTEPAVVLDISHDGALLRAASRPAVESSQSVRLIIDDQEINVEARVRHLKAVEPAAGRNPAWLIGLEFISASAQLVRAIDALIARVTTPQRDTA